MARAIAMVVGLACGGCSVLLVGGPEEPPRSPPECTESYTAPVVDLTFALLFESIAVGLVLDAKADRDVCLADDPLDEDATCGLTAHAYAPYVTRLASVAYSAALSGLGGYVAVTECRDAVRDWRRTCERSGGTVLNGRCVPSLTAPEAGSALAGPAREPVVVRE